MDMRHHAEPHHRVSIHSHNHHRLDLLHIAISLLFFWVKGERWIIHDGRPSDWCKGKAVFENSKSRPSKIPAQHPSMKGYPPDSIATYTPSYTATYPRHTETSCHDQKKFLAEDEKRTSTGRRSDQYWLLLLTSTTSHRDQYWSLRRPVLVRFSSSARNFFWAW